MSSRTKFASQVFSRYCSILATPRQDPLKKNTVPFLPPPVVPALWTTGGLGLQELIRAEKAKILYMQMFRYCPAAGR